MSISADFLKSIYKRPGYLDSDSLVDLLDQAMSASELQDTDMRPKDRRGLPGGIVYFNNEQHSSKPVIVIPDLHARMDFIIAVMQFEIFKGVSVLKALEDNMCIVICVGDGFHGEARVRDRWYKAFEEYTGDFYKHKAMDEEMRESLGLMEMVLHLRIHYPDNFFFLKGNHENIANEGIEGNYPFGKFVREGEMVTYWVRRFLGDEAFKGIYLYEKTLPILAVCNEFIVTHAEPARYYAEDDIRNCYLNPEVIYAFTWTDNNAAEDNSVKDILEMFFPNNGSTFMFGGHRPIRGKYNLRAGGRYIQLHNPDDYVVAVVREARSFNIEKDIHVIPRKTIR